MQCANQEIFVQLPIVNQLPQLSVTNGTNRFQIFPSPILNAESFMEISVFPPPIITSPSDQLVEVLQTVSKRKDVTKSTRDYIETQLSQLVPSEEIKTSTLVP